jgi:hypothetical protein
MKVANTEEDISKLVETLKSYTVNLIENFGSETPSFYDGFTVKY